MRVIENNIKLHSVYVVDNIMWDAFEFCLYIISLCHLFTKLRSTDKQVKNWSHSLPDNHIDLITIQTMVNKFSYRTKLSTAGVHRKKRLKSPIWITAVI